MAKPTFPPFSQPASPINNLPARTIRHNKLLTRLCGTVGVIVILRGSGAETAITDPIFAKVEGTPQWILAAVICEEYGPRAQIARQARDAAVGGGGVPDEAAIVWVVVGGEK